MMKKIVLIAAIFATAITASLGQGIISFANNSITRISTNDVFNTSATVIPVSGTGTWYYALFRAPITQTTINPLLDPITDGWTLVAIGTNSGSVPGRLSGNTTTEGVIATAIAPSTDNYAVAGWSVTLGTTWSEVEASFGNNSQMTADTFT